jgi:hypothetical protein
MELYSAIKNEILSFAGKWMALENIILSDISQVQKDKDSMFSPIDERQIQYKYKHYHIYIKVYI